MIMDSGAEEHVVSLAEWRSLGEFVAVREWVFLACSSSLAQFISDWRRHGSFLQFCGAWMVPSPFPPRNKMVELTALKVGEI